MKLIVEAYSTLFHVRSTRFILEYLRESLKYLQKHIDLWLSPASIGRRHSHSNMKECWSVLSGGCLPSLRGFCSDGNNYNHQITRL